MTSDLSKSEYLKRYLENDEKKAKRKKKPKPTNPHVSRIKIVDTNIDIKSIKFGDAVDENLYEDEEPVVADVIDDRPVEEKLKEVYESSRWKKLDSASDESNLQKIVKRPYLDSEPKKSPVKNHTQKRHDSDSDVSPPRTLSSRARHDSDSDGSPPRCKRPSQVQNKNHTNSDSDVSPPRRNQSTKVPPSQNSRKHSSKSKRVDSDSDLSPERMISRQKRTGARNSDSDLSPPRKSLKDGSPKRENKKRPRKTLSGLNAGLQDAASLRSETAELRVREKKLINELDAELSGRNAETVVRDKRTGKKRNLEEENNMDEEKQKKLSEVQRIYSKWGKGIEQAETQQLKVNEDMYELSKPLARYCDDEDLEARLKAVIHDDDPMAQYIKKKRQKDAIVMPEYTGPPPPPNRFGIKPGYRWDGVDRSNGFENKYFAKKSNAKALEDESYLWSVQDM